MLAAPAGSKPAVRNTSAPTTTTPPPGNAGSENFLLFFPYQGYRDGEQHGRQGQTREAREIG
jgi:hypothetical protein